MWCGRAECVPPLRHPRLPLAAALLLLVTSQAAAAVSLEEQLVAAGEVGGGLAGWRGAGGEDAAAAGSGDHHFVNQFAVEVVGGRGVAESVARQHGCHIHDQLFAEDKSSGREAVYLIECRAISRRSAEPSHSHMTSLKQSGQVRWVEQQFNKRRTKRDGSATEHNPGREHAGHSGAGAASHAANWARSSDGVGNRETFFTGFFGDFMRSLSFERPSSDSFFSSRGSEGHHTHSRLAHSFWPDPLFREQWYLNGGAKDGGDMHVMNVWKRGFTGKGVVVSILDDGIQPNHPDLIDNYDPAASLDINDNDDDPTPRDDGTNRHGTRCAGEVAAMAGNSVCGVGVAPNASIGGVRMLDGGVNDYVEAKALSYQRNHIDIYSASWGPEDDGKTVDGPGPLARRAFIDGVLKGRNGKGSIFVWASGNGGQYVDNCNCDGYTNSIFTLSISSASQAGHKPWYLEECASTLATTYSSGTPLQDKSVATCDQDAALRDKHICTVSHTGTSASAPLAAGLCALALEANPTLTWRDMQYIVLMTSRPEPLAKELGWLTNAVGRKVSHKFGYGMMDGEAMVNLAEKWTPVPPQHICISTIDTQTRLIPKQMDGRLHVSMDVNACNTTSQTVNYLEHVQCKVTLTYVPRGNLRLLLTSPGGTTSTLLFERPRDVTGSSFDRWPFMSVHFWGEPAQGRWNLTVINTRTHSSLMDGVLKEWQLILYGTQFEPVRVRREQTHPPPPPPRPPLSSPAARTSRVDLPQQQQQQQQTVQLASESAPLPSVMASPASAPAPAPAPDYCSPLCVQACRSPTSSDQHTCVRCRKEFNSRCLFSCLLGFYLTDAEQCLPCSAQCRHCYGPHSNQCLLCPPSSSLLPLLGTCVQQCPEAHFSENGTCRVCAPHCASCVSGHWCQACEGSLLLHDGRCVASCPAGTYRDQHRCAPCASTCATCSGPEHSQCVLCAAGLVYASVGRCARGDEAPCPTGRLCVSR